MSDIEINGSKIPAKNSYGQNGYQGPSSLTPGQSKADALITRKPDAVLDHVKKSGASYQAQPVENPLGTSYGHRDRNAESIATIPTKTDRSK